MDALLSGERQTEVIPFSLEEVEGPENANDLIPVLTDPDTAAPVALYYAYRDDAGLLSKEEGEPESCRCYYPFLDHSPELAALRAAAARGIPAAFIDLPYAEILRRPGACGPGRKNRATPATSIWPITAFRSGCAKRPACAALRSSGRNISRRRGWT